LVKVSDEAHEKDEKGAQTVTGGKLMKPRRDVEDVVGKPNREDGVQG